MSLSVLLSILYALPLSFAQGFWPAAVPLAVRSPYLNSWLDTNSRMTGGSTSWPQHWIGSQILGWAGLIRVDGVGYEWLGDERDQNRTTLQGIEITPTRSILSVRAGELVDLNITFLSPIEPDDLVLQSFPFAYIYVDVASRDGNAHEIQIYSDISAEWVTGDSGNLANWNTTTSSSIVYHTAVRTQPQPMQETRAVAEDGVVYFAASTNSDSTYMIGVGDVVRRLFTSTGTLANNVTADSGIINNPFYVFGHAKNLGTIQTAQRPMVWAIGLVRDPSITYTTASGNENRRTLFWSKYSSVEEGMTDFLSNFDSAQQRAIALDERVMSAARGISANYADLVGYSSHIALGSVEITYASDPSDVLMFLKALGDSDSSRRSNPVDVLFASFPTFIYYNATYGRYLLEPLLRYQDSALYSKAYAAPDLGSFPAVGGNSDPAVFSSLDDSASMLIMAWAHAKFSGDKTMLEQHYDLFKKWGQYLLNQNTLAPNGFQDIDGLDNTNMTNLALKGILGVSAMSNIASATGNDDDRNDFATQATSLIEQWKGLASTGDHLSSIYGRPSENALIYNLFADKWLGLDLVSDDVYNKQTRFYSQQFTSGTDYGLPYDGQRPDEVKAHWLMFTAATCTDDNVRNDLIDSVHFKASSNSSGGFFPTTYYLRNGSFIGDPVGPSHGAMFSLLAMTLQSSLDSTSASGGSSSSKAGPIAGGVVGGVALVGLVALGVFLWRRRRAQRKAAPKAHTVSGWPPSDEQYSSAIHLQQSSSGPLSTSSWGGGDNPSHTYVAGAATAQHGMPQEPSQTSFAPVMYGNHSQGNRNFEVRNHDPVQTFITPQAPPLPRKERRQLHGGNVTLVPPGQTAMNSTHNRGPSSSAGGSSSDRTDDSQLRSEVEILRREMEEMRARGLYEPPPQYN